MAYLGLLDEAGRLGVEQAADPRPPSRQQALFPEANAEPRFVEIDRTRVRVENCRQFGGPWLALELVKQLGLHEFLARTMPAGRAHVPWPVTALVLVIARLCEPSSELQIAEHCFRQTALGDLLGVPVDKVDDNRLDRGWDELLPHKPALEAFLKQRFGELFAIEYDLLLYDLTSTYFEGQADANPLAQRGDSRDHRPDLQAGLHRLGRRRAAACPWATKCSPATATIRPRWKSSSGGSRRGWPRSRPLAPAAVSRSGRSNAAWGACLGRTPARWDCSTARFAPLKTAPRRSPGRKSPRGALGRGSAKAPTCCAPTSAAGAMKTCGARPSN